MTAAVIEALAEYLDAVEVPGHAGLLEGAAGIYAVHAGAVDDRAIVGLVERWAAVRRRYANRSMPFSWLSRSSLATATFWPGRADQDD